MAEPVPGSPALSLDAAWRGAGDSHLTTDGQCFHVLHDWRPEDGGTVATLHQDGSPADDTSCDRDAWSSQLSAAESGPVNSSCQLCGEEGGAHPEALFPSPCGCLQAYVHLSCVENRINWGPEGNACPSCGVGYRVQRRIRSLWYWFVEPETRTDATMFVVNISFTLFNAVIVAFAWMYALFEDHPNAWISKQSLAAMLLAATVFWAAFGYFHLYIFYKPLARWMRANTTLTVLSDGDRAEVV